MPVPVAFNSENGTCEQTVVVRRWLPEADPALALNELFRGPTVADRQAGASSIFSPRTAELLRSVQVKSDTAYVDLSDAVRPRIGVAATSCGSVQFHRSVLETLKPFGADKVVFAFDGSPRDFTEWGSGTCDGAAAATAQCDVSGFK